MALVAYLAWVLLWQFGIAHVVVAFALGKPYVAGLGLSGLAGLIAFILEYDRRSKK